MKRLVGIMITVMLLLSSVTAYGTTLEDLKKNIDKVEDINSSKLTAIKDEMKNVYKDFDGNKWYGDYMAKLVGVGGINGYTNGTVKPNGTITRAEFTKILIAILYGEQDTSIIHWSWNYKEKAEDARILSRDEFKVSNLDEAITREEMAKMVVLAAERKLKETSKVIDNVDRLIEDIDDASSGGQDYIRIAYSKGIIGGYPDNTFRPKGNATRAEACTILVRLLDEDMRIDVVVPEEKEIKTFEYRGYEVPEYGETDMKIAFSTDEEIKQGYVEISFRIKITGELEEQYDTLEKALDGKFKKATIEKVLNKVKKKTSHKDVFETLNIYEGNYVISIGSEYKSGYVVVDIWQE